MKKNMLPSAKLCISTACFVEAKQFQELYHFKYKTKNSELLRNGSPVSNSKSITLISK